MKKLNIFLTTFFLIAILSISCKKEETKLTYNGGKAPILSADVSNNSNLPISYNNRDANAITFSWTNPDYQFSNGVSSLDVTYLIEIDSAGKNFSSSMLQSKAVEKSLSKSLTCADINEFLIKMIGVDTSKTVAMEARVKSYLKNSAGIASTQLISNMFKFSAKQYGTPPKIELPVSGELFLIGSATPGGWPNPVPIAQKFTKTGATIFEIEVQITGGVTGTNSDNSYKIIPVNGDWKISYGLDGPNNSNSSPFLSGDFKLGGNNIAAPETPGKYRIKLDFQTGVFSVSPI
jgi:starch-binding outer membrane protein SusE/F